MGLFDVFKKTLAASGVTITKHEPKEEKSAPVQAENRITYSTAVDFELKEVAGGAFEITKYVGFEEERMEIPAQLNGQRIVGIGAEVFAELPSLTHLKIADGIQYIGDKAFYHCVDLVNVVFPNTLEKIGAYCFAESGLETVALPASASQVSEGCFSECKQLTAAYLPAHMPEIPAKMFYQCEQLSNVRFPEDVSVVGNGAFDNAGLILTSLPETCTVIGDKAFSGCFDDEDGNYPSVPEFRLPSGLTTVGEGGLGGLNCRKLIVPASVKNLGKEAFSYISSDDDEQGVDVIFVDGCSAALPEGLFYENYVLGSITIPSSITTIGEIFRGTSRRVDIIYVTDEYGRQVYDRHGKEVTKSVWYDETTNTPPEDLTIYCDPGSAAMNFAREKSINCAKRER